MTLLKQLNVRLPVELHRALARHKELTGEDKSEVIRRGIELALRETPTIPASAPVTKADEDGAGEVLERVRALISQRT